MCGRTACSLSKCSLQKATSRAKDPDVIIVSEDTAGKSCDGEKENSNTNIVETTWVTIHSSMDYKSSYNQAPSSFLPILVSSAHHDPKAEENDRSIIPMSWGLVPSWFKGDKSDFKSKTINARSDKLIDGETTIYKNCLSKGRCGLLLVEGYFEWTRDKQPHLFYLPQNENINYKTRENWSEADFVGSDGKWKGPKIMTIPVVFDVNNQISSNGSPFYSFAIITTNAHDELQWIHDRMPAILDNDEDRDKWLNFKQENTVSALELIREPFAGLLEYHVVTDKVGNTRYQDIDCVLAVDTLKEDKKPKQLKIDSFFRRVPNPESSPQTKIPKLEK